MKSSIQIRTIKAKNLSSFDEMFVETNALVHSKLSRQFLLTLDTNQSKPHERHLKTQPSTSINKKSRPKKLQGVDSRIKLLRKLRSVCNEFDLTNKISQPICKSVYSILNMLIKEESNYGPDMQKFFQILKRLIFCDQSVVLANLEEFGEGQKKPYNSLVMDVLEQKHKKLAQKEKEIAVQVIQINAKIVTMERNYRDKINILNVQHQNNMTAVRTQCQSEVNQLKLKIGIMRETLETYERKFRKVTGTAHTKPWDEKQPPIDVIDLTKRSGFI